MKKSALALVALVSVLAANTVVFAAEEEAAAPAGTEQNCKPGEEGCKTEAAAPAEGAH